MNEDNSVYIGRKPAMNYVLAVVTQFNKGSDTVIVKARGKSISRAVDVVEIVRNRFISNLIIEDIAIDTEKLQLENKKINVSSMEITVKSEGEPKMMKKSKPAGKEEKPPEPKQETTDKVEERKEEKKEQENTEPIQSDEEENVVEKSEKTEE